MHGLRERERVVEAARSTTAAQKHKRRVVDIADGLESLDTVAGTSTVSFRFKSNQFLCF